MIGWKPFSIRCPAAALPGSPIANGAITSASPITITAHSTLRFIVTSFGLPHPRWELGDVTVDVEYDNQAKPRRFDVAIRVGADLDDSQLERLEQVARSCPLRRSIEAGAEFEETFTSSVLAGGPS